MENLMQNGAAYTCYYEEEARALEMIVNWADESFAAGDSIGAYTDSQSLCGARLIFTPDIDPIQSNPGIQMFVHHAMDSRS